MIIVSGVFLKSMTDHFIIGDDLLGVRLVCNCYMCDNSKQDVIHVTPLSISGDNHNGTF